MCATKVTKVKHGRPLKNTSELKSEIAILALQEILKDKMLKRVILNLSRWSAQIAGGRGSQISYTCSADGVTARGRGWQLSIDDISSQISERDEYLILKRTIEKLLRSDDGKR